MAQTFNVPTSVDDSGFCLKSEKKFLLIKTSVEKSAKFQCSLFSGISKPWKLLKKM